MRDDMVKLVNSGGKRSRKKNRAKYKRHLYASHNLGNAPTKEGIARHYDSWDDEGVSSHRLGPLLRWLHKQAGRDWDEIYSEICNAFRDNTAGSQHVHLWLSYYVTPANELEIVDGEIYDKTSRWGSKMHPVGRFLVHPETNKLSVNPHRYTKSRYRKKNSPTEVTSLDTSDPLIKYKKIDGVWYEVAFREVDPNAMRSEKYQHPKSHYDLLKRDYASASTLWSRYDAYIVPSKKRQVNSKTVKKIMSSLQ